MAAVVIVVAMIPVAADGSPRCARLAFWRRSSKDGVPKRAAGEERSGSGLADLTARVQAVGGQLTSRQADGRFELLAEIPPTAPAS
jgi:hypothetical protein